MLTNIEKYETAKKILEKNKILTTYDNEEMFLYINGIYRPQAENYIKEKIQQEINNQNSAHTTNEILGHIKRETYTHRELFDNYNTFEICLKNGILDLTTNQLLPHTPEKKFISQIPLEYNPTIIDCPKIDKFFKEVLEEENANAAYELFAYTLLKTSPLQKAFMLIGSGRNGKSTFINLLAHFIGIENCTNISLQELEENRFSRADLYGKHINYFADLPDEALKNTGIFKSITGNDRIKGEHKFKNGFFFTPFAKLVFSANLLPRTPDDTDAFYRRWLLLPFNNEFDTTKGNLNENILKELTTKSEMQGLLTKCLEILPTLLKNKKFTGEESIEMTRRKYTRLSDPIGCFIMDKIEQDPEKYISKQDLYNKFLAYCRKNRYPITSERMFSLVIIRQLNVIDFRPYYLGERPHCWKGISYVDDTST